MTMSIRQKLQSMFTEDQMKIIAESLHDKSVKIMAEATASAKATGTWDDNAKRIAAESHAVTNLSQFFIIKG